MDAVDVAAFGSFVTLAIAWVILPLKAPAVPAAIAPSVALEAAT